MHIIILYVNNFKCRIFMCRKLYVYKFYVLFGEIYCECSVIKILCLGRDVKSRDA